MDESRGYNGKQNKLIRERQIPYDFTHLWNLRNKTDGHKGRTKGGREANQKTHNHREQTEGCWRGVGWRERARWGMGIKGGPCRAEHWVLHVSDESLNSTPETNFTICVN